MKALLLGNLDLKIVLIIRFTLTQRIYHNSLSQVTVFGTTQIANSLRWTCKNREDMLICP